MPARQTLLNWLSGSWPEGDPRREFLGQYARAREAQAELYADDIIDIADADDEDALLYQRAHERRHRPKALILRQAQHEALTPSPFIRSLVWRQA